MQDSSRVVWALANVRWGGGFICVYKQGSGDRIIWLTRVVLQYVLVTSSVG